MIYAMADTDVRNAQFFGSVLIAWLGLNTAAGWSGTSTNAAIGALYDSNALVYQSPTFAGASIARIRAGRRAGQFQGGTRESVVLRYANDGLNASAAYYNGHDTARCRASRRPASTTTVSSTSARSTRSTVSVSASYGNGRNPSHADKVNLDMLSAGIGYRFTPALQVTSAVYYLKDRNVSTNKSTAVVLRGRLQPVEADDGLCAGRPREQPRHDGPDARVRAAGCAGRRHDGRDDRAAAHLLTAAGGA